MESGNGQESATVEASWHVCRRKWPEVARFRAGLQTQGSGFRVQGLGFRVQGLGIYGSRFRI